MFSYLASGFSDSLFCDLNPIDFIDRYQLQSAIRKLVPRDTREIDAATADLFFRMNKRCASYDPSDYWHDPSWAFVAKARFHLDQIFYNSSEFVMNLMSISEGFDLGPGANRKSHKSCSYLLKMAKGLSGSTNQIRLIEAVRDFSPTKVHFGRGRHVVCGSSLSFVPKTAKSSRLICTEPTAAMLLQKGISSIIERILQSQFNIDLTTQPSRQHDLAREGSCKGTFATLDLSSASDSISLNFCRVFLPDVLFKWLLVARSSHVEWGDTITELHMISTMGNGFTFSLQTMIFAALAHACSEGLPYGVFGDDIIVHSKVSERMVRVLHLCGFTLNSEKSFLTGPFRETCGMDFLNGVNVRPFFIKNLRDKPDVCVVINGIRRWARAHQKALPSFEGFATAVIRALDLPEIPDDDRLSDDIGVKIWPGLIPTEMAYVAGDPPRLDRRTLKNGSRILCYKFKGFKVKASRANFDPDTLFQGAFSQDLNRAWFNEPGVFLDACLRGAMQNDVMAFRAVRREHFVTTYLLPL